MSDISRIAKIKLILGAIKLPLLVLEITEYNIKWNASTYHILRENLLEELAILEIEVK